MEIPMMKATAGPTKAQRSGKGLVAGIVACMLLSVLTAQAALAQDSLARMRAALDAADRPAENKARDEARKPVETIQFLGIEEGMTTLDIIAAGGWFTEVLSAAVGPQGKVYSQNPDFFVNRPGFVDSENALIQRLGNVQAVHGDLGAAGINGQVDVAVTAMNLHDMFNSGGMEAGVALAKGAFDALKPGGVFGVIDHVGIAGQDNAQLHRIRKEDAIAVLEQAGFVIEASSDLLANPADDHTKGPGDPSLGRRSDQFLIKARKPQ